MIKFSEIKGGIYSINELSKILQSNIKKESYFYSEEFEIIYSCLLLFNFRNLKQEKESVVKYSNKIFDFYKDKVSVETSFEFFIKKLLDLRISPIKNKIELETKAKSHLRLVEDLIKEYLDKFSFINDYEKNRYTARNNEQRTIIEFYNRTKSKRSEIQKFIIEDINERAIEKSTYMMKTISDKMGGIYEQFEKYRDFPYYDFIFISNKWDCGLDFKKLDYRKINILQHKRRIIGKIKSNLSDILPLISCGHSKLLI